ncbi:ADP-ribosylation factor GTPase-activating protein AGD5-like isoform X2 [Diospyros lotus]|uniref:ADP-ribosylation factor GTPase-activating protein AGD5-like isoform X2 n=1 Tax=Diospyros lotus TaxID=55363 RepID=UPI002258FDA3|nr:ADP-ribosylation factor GTPase-activating protein AGD5-like isoform X2 [Diospyros lotus]
MMMMMMAGQNSNRRPAFPSSLMPGTERYWMGFLSYQRTENAQTAKARPRWASVNLGIFICMQCSGIHRSLGVHISKVRSATLDTWLPDQVALIQSMGNEKSNSYWEAELPPNYDRVGIENFIRAKYIERRWVPRDGKTKSSSTRKEEKISVYKPDPGTSNGVRYPDSFKQSLEEGSSSHPPKTSRNVPSTNIQNPVSAEASQQDTTDLIKREVQNPETAAWKSESGKRGATAATASSEPKVDYATQLFHLLSMDDYGENGFKPSIAGQNGWAEFQYGKSIQSNPVGSEFLSKSGFEDLFGDLQWVTTPTFHKPPEDAKKDIMDLFDKSTMVSPVSVPQQLPLLPQQHHLLKPFGVSPTFHGSSHLYGPNGKDFPTQIPGSSGNQVPRVMVPMPDLKECVQTRNTLPSVVAGAAAFVPTRGVCSTGPPALVNYETAGATRTPAPTFPAPATVSTQSGRDNDFSSLVQGMFSKRL